MTTEGILKVQLFNLEKSAETLERIIYSDLTALHSLPDSKVEAYEPRVLRKLEKLDELQDEIDTVTAELKAAGWYESRTTGRNIYEYKRPKIERPKPEPKPRKPRVVHPATPPKTAKAKATDAEKLARQAAREAAKVDAALQRKKTKLEIRLIERKAKVAEVANLTKQQGGSQKRNNARKNLLNVERQLEELNALIANRSQIV